MLYWLDASSSQLDMQNRAVEEEEDGRERQRERGTVDEEGQAANIL